MEASFRFPGCLVPWVATFAKVHISHMAYAVVIKSKSIKRCRPTAVHKYFFLWVWLESFMSWVQLRHIWPFGLFIDWLGRTISNLKCRKISMRQKLCVPRRECKICGRLCRGKIVFIFFGKLVRCATCLLLIFPLIMQAVRLQYKLLFRLNIWTAIAMETIT